MSDRKSLILTLWLTSSLSLLAWVLVAPPGTSGFDAASSRADCRPLKEIALPPGEVAPCLSPASTTDAVLEVDAFPSEDEEQDRAVVPDEPRALFLLPCSFRKLPDRPLIAARSIFAFYPIRS